MSNEALTCSAARPLLERLAAGELGPAELGRVEGHIYGCDDCAEAAGQLAAHGIAAGRLSKPRGAPQRRAHGPAPRSQKVLMWHRHRSSPPEAFRRSYCASLGSAAAARGVPLAGGPAVEVLLQAIDPSWNIIDTEPVRSYVVSPPVFTPDGEFRMTLELAEEDSAECEGRSVVCLLKISDETWIGFESLITGGGVAFSEKGLPRLESYAMPPPESFEFYLAVGSTRRPES